MICESCSKCKTCKVPANVRILRTWCKDYVYSSKMEKLNTKSNK